MRESNPVGYAVPGGEMPQIMGNRRISMRRTEQDIVRRAARLGLGVDTYRPGDGITRYRFRATPGGYADSDMGGLGGEYGRTTLGVKDADTWLDGYSAAYFLAESRRPGALDSQS